MTTPLLTLLLTLISTVPCGAFELAAGLTPPGKQKTLLSYSGTFHESADFAQGRAAIPFHSVDFSTPVYKTEESSISASLGGSELSVRPAQSNLSELYDVKLGLSYTKALPNDRLWAVSTRYGSASDRPFADSSVSTLGFTGFYSFSNDETSRWLLLVDYSNNRPILNNIPLPGFAYFYNPSKEFRGVFGAPFASINWSFTEKWSLDLFTIVPWVLKGSFSYKLNEYARAYTGLDFSQMTFYIHGRENKKERLFYDEKRLFVGIKSPLSKSIFADLEAGHAFDRAVFSAENYKFNPENPVDIGNAYYAKITMRFIFQ